VLGVVEMGGAAGGHGRIAQGVIQGAFARMAKGRMPDVVA